MTPKICFDRVLPRDKFTPLITTGRLVVRLIAPLRKQWINGSTLTVRFMGGTPEQQQTVRQEARWWEESANIKFDFTDALNADIRIAFDPNDGAWSYIGTDCASIPQSEPTMNLGFLDPGTAAHEFGHALGVGHEHQNPDGGIQWNEPVVIRDLEGPPNSWDEDTIRHNVLEKYSLNQSKGTKFDPDSIMLYWFPPEWTINGMSTHQNNSLSSLDRSFMGGAQMYPMPTPEAPIEAVSLKLDARAKQASIGKPGEEDLYTFTVTGEKKGYYTIKTQGKTNVIMRLYGPDSQTLLLAEDDDSGRDKNALIMVGLIPGTYFVQVRHSDLAAGTGRYSIKVEFHAFSA